MWLRAARKLPARPYGVTFQKILTLGLLRENIISWINICSQSNSIWIQRQALYDTPLQYSKRGNGKKKHILFRSSFYLLWNALCFPTKYLPKKFLLPPTMI